MALDCQRSNFELPDNAHYLNCAYMSPLATRVIDAGIRAVRSKAVPTTIGPSDFFTGADRARSSFARLIGAEAPERVAIIPATSYAVATCARNLDLGAGQNVVTIQEQFPGNVYTWRSMAQKTGVEVRTVKAPDGEHRGQRWNERILEAIDESTTVVSIGSVHWTDGTRFDLEAIGARAREVGAAYLVDGTQSIGALPFDLNRVQPDAVIVAAYKWLMGPYSIGCAYYGPRFDGGEPLEETWIARRGSEDFAGLVDYQDQYQPGAIRFDVGERSNFTLMPMLNEALEMVLKWTPEAIQEYVIALTEPLFAKALDLGYAIEDEPYRSGHLFGLRVPESVSIEAIKARCAERRVSVSQRGTSIRVSPHVYNTPADIDALLDAITVA